MIKSQQQIEQHVRGGRMTKVSGQVASFAPSMVFAVSAVALGSTGALAQTVIDGPMSIYVIEDFDEIVTINPNGSIVQDSGNTFAIGYDGGVSLTDFDGSVLNDGAIGLEIYADDGAALDISSASLGGKIQNDGLIETRLFSDSTGAYNAAGIVIDGDVLLDASILNEGEILVDVDVYSDYASGYASAIFVDGNLLGTVANNGEISVSAAADGYSSYSAAAGIYVSGEVEGYLNVAGELEVNADTDGEWYSSANAIGVYVDADVTGELNSSGSITVGASLINDYNYSFATATGIEVQDVFGGVFISEGAISVDAIGYGGGAGARASGIDIYDVREGATVKISGNIDVVAEAETVEFENYSGARAIGVSIEDITDASVTTAANISVKATADDYSYAGARGIYIDDLEDGGTLTNLGNIKVDVALANYSYGGNADGIYVDSDVDGNASLLNKGNIFVTIDTTSTGYIEVSGIKVDSDLGEDEGSALVSNSGLIEATAINGYTIFGDPYASDITVNGIFVDDNIGESDATGRLENTSSGEIYVLAVNSRGDATGFGLGVNNDLGENTVDSIGTGYINNFGLLDVSVQAGSAPIAYYGDAFGYGIYVGETLSFGAVRNSGELNVSALAPIGQAYAQGIYINGQVDDGVVANTDRMFITAEGEDAEANGIYVGDYVYGEVLNSGRITATADGASEAIARGISAASDVIGSITNEGVISVKVNDDATTPYAEGIFVETLRETGMVTNSGTIYAENGEDGVGIYVETLSGKLINSGMLLAGVDGTPIYVGSGSGTTYLMPGTVLQGTVQANDTEFVLVSGPSSSVVWNIDGYSKVTTDDSSGRAWFTDGLGTYATFDPAINMSAMQSSLSTAAAQSSSLMFDSLTIGTPLVTRGGSGEAGNGWIKGVYSDNSYAGEGDASTEYSTGITSLAAGYNKPISSMTSVGFMAGATDGTTNYVDSFAEAQESSFSGAFGGVGVAHMLGTSTFKLGFAAGMMDHESERTINNSTIDDAFETARSSFGSNWLSASAGVSRDFMIGDTLRVTPSASYQMVQQRVDAYTEEGASENAEVDGFKSGANQLAGEIEIGYVLGSGEVTGSVGFLSQTSNGDGSVDVTLLGDTQTVKFSSGDFNAMTVGIDYSMPIGEGGYLDLAADYMFGDDITDASGSISALVSFKF